MKLERDLVVPYNFELVFEQYQQAMRKLPNSIDHFTKPVCSQAFAHLLEMELISYVDRSSFGTMLIEPTSSSASSTVSLRNRNSIAMHSFAASTHRHFRMVRLVLLPNEMLLLFQNQELSVPTWLAEYASGSEE